MIFDLNREPFVVRIERWTTCDCPGFEDAIKLKAEIIVEAPRGVLLDNVAARG